ncbi:unnamed protein product [Rhodiola kirilowii]
MAKSLISPFPPPFTASGRLPGRESVFFRNQDRVLMKRNKNGENALCACLASNSAELNELCRRDLILLEFHLRYLWLSLIQDYARRLRK